MNVRDAIALMVKNPAVGFSWESTLITLVNGFLPPDHLLDAATAEAAEIQAALATLDAATQEMILTSSLGASQVGSPPPSAIPTPATIVTSSPSEFQKLIGLFILFITVLFAVKSGMNMQDIIDLIKVLAGMDGVPAGP
jgi:hypothetical protein